MTIERVTGVLGMIDEEINDLVELRLAHRMSPRVKKLKWMRKLVAELLAAADEVMQWVSPLAGDNEDRDAAAMETRTASRLESAINACRAEKGERG